MPTRKVCPHWRIIDYNNRKIAILPLQPVQ